MWPQYHRPDHVLAGTTLANRSQGTTPWARGRNDQPRSAQFAQTILASIDLLSQSRLSREHDLLAAARAAGHALRRLLDRSLAFSRLASGSFRPHVVPCDVGQLCAHALDAIRPEALRRGLSLA